MIGELNRIVLLVRDLGASIQFYKGTLGLVPVREPASNWAEFRAGEVLLCLHGPWEGMPYDPDDFGRSPDEILFTVQNLDEVREQLMRRGVAVTEPHEPGPGIRVAELRDPEGRRIGLECRA